MKRLIVSAAMLLAAAAPLAAVAPPAVAQASAGRLTPLSRVIQTLKQSQPGRFLNATQGETNGRAAYFVQWQRPNGQIVVFVVDAESGQVVGQQGG